MDVGCRELLMLTDNVGQRCLSVAVSQGSVLINRKMNVEFMPPQGGQSHDGGGGPRVVVTARQ